MPINDRENSNEESSEKAETSRGFWIALVVLALLAIPASRLQNAFKILEWTLILCGACGAYVIPYVRDASTIVVFSCICIAHALIVWALYPFVLNEGYLAIGGAVIAEILIFSIPAGWIIVHSRSKRS